MPANPPRSCSQGPPPAPVTKAVSKKTKAAPVKEVPVATPTPSQDVQMEPVAAAVEEPEPLPTVSQIPASQSRKKEEPAPSQDVEEEAEAEPEPEPEPKGRGNKRKAAAAGGRKKGAQGKRKGKQEAEVEPEVEPEPETQEADSQQMASQIASQVTASQEPAAQEEEEEPAPAKKGGRKIRLRKAQPEKKEKESAEPIKAPVLAQRGGRGKKGAKVEEDSQMETAAEEASQTVDPSQESQTASQAGAEEEVPSVATKDVEMEPTKVPSAIDTPADDSSRKESEVAAPTRSEDSSFVRAREDSTVHQEQNNQNASKRPLDSTRPISKKPRADMFNSEAKPSAMKFPRLADTLSAVDFNIRPSMSRETETQIEPLLSDTGEVVQPPAEIVERAETEALRQDERLQTIIKSSVDKLKGDLSRLKKTNSGSSSQSSNNSANSSQGGSGSGGSGLARDESLKSKTLAAARSATATTTTAQSQHTAAPEPLEEPATVASQRSREEPSSTPRYVVESDESRAQPAPVKAVQEVAASQDSIANSQGFNLIRETMPEMSQQSQLSTDPIDADERLSMSFFGAVPQSDNLAGGGTFIPSDLSKETASQKQQRLEIKALAAAASAKEKEEMDRERRQKMKEQVEEKRREALLRKQQEEAKRAEEIKRREEEWKRKADAPASRPVATTDKTKDVLEKAKAAEALKMGSKDPVGFATRDLLRFGFNCLPSFCSRNRTSRRSTRNPRRFLLKANSLPAPRPLLVRKTKLPWPRPSARGLPTTRPKSQGSRPRRTTTHPALDQPPRSPLPNPRNLLLHPHPRLLGLLSVPSLPTLLRLPSLPQKPRANRHQRRPHRNRSPTRFSALDSSSRPRDNRLRSRSRTFSVARFLTFLPSGCHASSTEHKLEDRI